DQNSSVDNTGGTITVKDNGTFNVDTASIDKGTVNVHADDADGADAGTVPGIMNLKGGAVFTNGTLNNDGAITVTNAGNKLDNEDVTNTGSISVAAAADLKIDTAGTLNNSGTITVAGTAEIDTAVVTNSGTVTVNAAATLTLDQNSSVDNTGGTITVKDNGTFNVDTASIDKGTVNVHADDADGADAGTVPGIMNLKGGAVFTNGTLNNDGAITVTNAGNKLDNEDVTNTGSISVAAAADLKIDTAGTLNNSGTITVAGTAEIDNDVVTNSGTVTVNAAATL